MIVLLIIHNKKSRAFFDPHLQKFEISKIKLLMVYSVRTKFVFEGFPKFKSISF